MSDWSKVPNGPFDWLDNEIANRERVAEEAKAKARGKTSGLNMVDDEFDILTREERFILANHKGNGPVVLDQKSVTSTELYRWRIWGNSVVNIATIGAENMVPIEKIVTRLKAKSELARRIPDGNLNGLVMKGYDVHREWVLYYAKEGEDVPVCCYPPSIANPKDRPHKTYADQLGISIKKESTPAAGKKGATQW